MKTIELIILPFVMLGLSACTDTKPAPVETDNAETSEVVPIQSLSAKFVGDWQVARPDGPGVIVNEPIASCDAPIIVLAEDQDTISYLSPGNPTSYFDLMAFNDRTTWIPMNADGTEVNGPYTYIAEMTSDDTFLFYTATIGKADWDDPREYTRCP